MNRTPILLILLLLSFSITNAGNKLKSEYGYWDFNTKADVRLKNNDYIVNIIVWNKSTDDSYRCDGCSNGCGTVKVDYELWSPDQGMVRSSSFYLRDICNGGYEQEYIHMNLTPKFGRLELRWNVTTPNGGHSFQRRSRMFKF